MKRAVCSVVFAAALLVLGLSCAGAVSPEPPKTPQQDLNAEGLRRLERGEFEGAEEVLRRALREAQLVDDLQAQAEAWNNLGALAMAQGQVDTARAHHAAALRVHRVQGTPGPGEVTTRTNLGSALLAAGDVKAATEQFEEAIRLAESVNAPGSALLARVGLAAAHLRASRVDDAARLVDLAVAEARREKDRRALSGALLVAGSVNQRRGDLGAARLHYEEALALDRELGTPQSVVEDLLLLAGVVRSQGRATEACRLLVRASRVDRNLSRLDRAVAELRHAIDLGRGGVESDELDEYVAELSALESLAANEAAAREPSSADGGSELDGSNGSD